MTKRQWKIVIGLNLLTIILILLPFLPGPAFLYYPAQLFYNAGPLVAPFGLLLVPVGLIWTYFDLKRRKKDNTKHIRSIAILLWTIPIVIFLTSVYLADLTRDISRKIAISNADKLISAIEYFKSGKGEYPNNLDELKPAYLESIPSTWIIGIPWYGYQKTEQSYKVVFTQNVILGFNFEVVEYSPTNDHKAEGTCQTLYDCGREHWKYYIYD